MRNNIIALLLLSGLSLIVQAAQKPNIVLLFADDAGYADFGFHGSKECRTPHLDQLAKEGVLCTQAYVSSAVCGPSRAGLLTGRYQQRFGFEENNVPAAMSGAGLTGEDMGLPEEMTIADHLKAQGYRSIILGKWHLGGADRFHPLERGFDEFYGFRGARRYYAYKKNRSTRSTGWSATLNFKEHEGYLTDVLGDEACEFIERNQVGPSLFICRLMLCIRRCMHVRGSELVYGAEENPTKASRDDVAMDRACARCSKLEALGWLTIPIVFTNDNGGTPLMRLTMTRSAE